MAVPLSQVSLSALFPMLKALEKEGADEGFVLWARKPQNAQELMHFCREQMGTPSYWRQFEESFTVQADYSMPRLSQLRMEFAAGVSGLFDGRPWERNASCVSIDETPGERHMFVKVFGQGMTTEAVIAWALENGYRPAIEREARSVGVSPDARFHWGCGLVALGSYALSDKGHPDVTVLKRFSMSGASKETPGTYLDGSLLVGHALHVFSRDKVWRPLTRFLLVQQT